VGAYKAARPQLVHMSSGGVERNARIETVEDRKACTMPIVQLNPGGTLNHKYFGETAVRNAGLQYTVVRAAGLVTEDLDKSFTLQALQGDRTSGRLSRAEAASVLAAACASPTATGKTFEVRRADEENNELTHDMAVRVFLRLPVFGPVGADQQHSRRFARRGNRSRPRKVDPTRALRPWGQRDLIHRR